MVFPRILLALSLASPLLLFGQADYRVYNDHPRLLLDADRLKRLSREAERQTDRWRLVKQQLSAGDAMPERAVALALSHQIMGDEPACREAVELARDLRQTALAFDWCHGVLDAETRSKLAAQLVEQAAVAPSTAEGLRDAVLALVAAAGEGQGAEAALGRVLTQIWDAKLLPELEGGGLVDEAASLVALLETAHVLRYNLDRDIWNESPEAFRALPMARVLGYLPQTLESEEGRLRRYALSSGDPMEDALLGRVAEMLLIAYESASRPSQFLQGWLRNDTYTLKGPRGALYEFLWLNPYLPGLAPASAPKWTFDSVRGRIFARADDRWIGYFQGELKVDSGSGMQPAGAELRGRPFYVEGAAIIWTAGPGKWDVQIPEGRDPQGPVTLLIGLEAGRDYSVRAGKGAWRQVRADRGGVLAVRNDYEAQQTGLVYGESVRVQLK